MNHTIAINDHLRPPQTRNIPRKMRSSIRRSQHRIAIAQIGKQYPRKDIRCPWRMVASIVVDDADAVLVEAVVGFLVDGIEVDDCGRREANGKLEEEVLVLQDGLVEVGRGVAATMAVKPADFGCRVAREPGISG